jgi:glycerol kinase
MTQGRFVLALDQGTTSSRAIVFDRSGKAVSRGPAGVPADLPGPGAC